MSLVPVAIITGASSGIGEATARLLSRSGYRVVLAARRYERLLALAEEIRRAGGEAMPVAADLSKLEDVRHVVKTTLETYGRIDLLFNNAGLGRLNWLEKLDPVNDVQAVIGIDLLGLIWMTQETLPSMIAQRSGHIINMGSVASLVATPTYSIYAASKFGVRGFTEALRREVGIYGIRVSGIYPGGTRTEFAEKAGIQRKTRKTTPAFLRLSADSVAKAVLSLARRPRRSLIIPWPMRLAVLLNTLFPAWMDALVEWRFTRPERLR